MGAPESSFDASLVGASIWLSSSSRLPFSAEVLDAEVFMKFEPGGCERCMDDAGGITLSDIPPFSLVLFE